jgi:hypothetical protein
MRRTRTASLLIGSSVARGPTARRRPLTPSRGTRSSVLSGGEAAAPTGGDGIFTAPVSLGVVPLAPAAGEGRQHALRLECYITLVDRGDDPARSRIDPSDLSRLRVILGGKASI